MEIIEVNITHCLNKTSINLGERVINPYKGCAYGCVYCYVRSNKSTKKDSREWGTYVEARINSPEILVKELEKLRVKRVLLGSTTECFQPIEKTYKLTERILKILNQNSVTYTIMTRSPDIIDCLPLLKKGFCDAVYFTVNSYPERLKRFLESKSPSFDGRMAAIKALTDNGIKVIPYVSPVMPMITDIPKIVNFLKGTKSISFEGLNFKSCDTKNLLDEIKIQFPETYPVYFSMLNDEKFFNKIWEDVSRDIKTACLNDHVESVIYLPKYQGFYDNIY